MQMIQRCKHVLLSASFSSLGAVPHNMTSDLDWDLNSLLHMLKAHFTMANLDKCLVIITAFIGDQGKTAM